jgi:hypothetical protein
VGPALALGFDAATFAASFTLILFVRVVSQRSATSQERSFRRELLEGLRFFVSSRVLMTILSVGVIIMLGAGALNALDVFFVIGNLHASASLYGALDAGLGVGALAGAVLAAAFAERLGLTRTFWISSLLAGLAMVVYSRMTSFLPAFVLLVLAGVPIAALNVTVQPLILLATPQRLIGRVTAVLGPAISLASMLSMAAAGYLDSTLLRHFHARLFGVHLGPVDTIFSAGGLLALAGGLYAWSMFSRRSPAQGPGTGSGLPV